MNDKGVIGKPRIDLKDKLDILVPDKEVLQPGDLGATIELIVREGINDPEGKIVQHIRPKRSESFTRQFMDLLWAMFQNISEINPMPVRDTSNIVHNIGFNFSTFNCNAAAASVLSGIVVGTGNTAPDISDYHLETLILHDAAPPTAGRMGYSILTFGLPASDINTSQFTITRNFSNASGGAITVNEVGLYVLNTKGDNAAPLAYYFMTIRDVIGGGIAVPNGQTLTVNYRPQAII